MKFGVKFLAILLVSLICATMLTSCFSGLNGDDVASSDTSSDNIIVIPPNGDHGGNNGNDGGNNGNTSGSVVIENITAPYIADVHVSTSVEPDEENKVPSGGVNLDSSLASATIPGGVQLEEGAKEVVLTINGIEDSKADVELLESEVSSSFDVHVSGVAENNLVPMEIKLAAAAAKGLNSTSIKLYHVENGETVAMTLIPSSAEFTAHNQFKYNPATGDITLSIASFSEIMVVSDTENAWNGTFDYSWYDANPEADEFIIASAEQLAAFGAIVGGMRKVTGRNDENGTYTYDDGYAYTGTYDDGTEYHHYSFAGKTVTLIANINLGDKESENNPDIIFYPIGYYNEDGTYEKTNKAITSGFRIFEGIFDGNGHTISNFYQNTWEMKGDHNWYDGALQYYRDGMGLFGRVCGGTVKNLTVENFSSDGEITTTGVIAAYADGATFENISIFNCNPRVYNTGNGGIVGCVGWYAKEADLKTTFTNITVDNSNKISALWGSYDVACGGIVGQYYPTSGQSSYEYPVNGGIEFTNCHVSAVMDVYNDVCANYQYYAYRYTGMFIGSVRENETINGYVYPKMDGIVANGCTVHFGDWNDYYYCELVANSLASYTHDHQMSRLTQVASVDAANMTVTDLDGNEAAIPTEGRVNYVVVKAKGDDGKWIHGDGHDYAECYHFVNGVQHFHDVADSDNPTPTEMVNGVETLKEDKQCIYLEFSNLVTGYGWGVTTKVVGDLSGVTILDREIGDSIDKFVYTEDSNALKPSTGATINIGTLFSAKNQTEVELLTNNIIVSVTPLGEDSTVRATYNINTSDWTLGTLTFSGVGKAKVTITDYYFCNPTSVTIDVQPVDKFETKFTNNNFTYRVGNQNAIALGSIFGALQNSNIPIDNSSVNISIEGTDKYTFNENKSDWTKAELKFENYVGNATIAIKDATSTTCSVSVEVINATNATGASNAIENNVVLLQDCGFSSLEVSGGFTLFGNGFTMTCASDSYALDTGYAFVTLDSGTLDNVQIVCPNFDYAVLYKSNMTETGNRSYTDENGKTRYYNVKSGVMVNGNSQILNSRISGARAAVNVASGNVIIDNSRIELGAVASILVGAANSVTLRNVTLVQEPTASSYDPSKKLMGFSVLMVCNSDGDAASITLEGELVQNAWANEDDKAYVPSAGSSIINTVLSQTDYLHDLDDDKTNESANLGFAYMPESSSSKVNTTTIVDNRTNKSNIPYQICELKTTFTTYVYSYINTNGTDDNFINTPKYTPNKFSDIIEVGYSDTTEGLTTDKSFGTNGWVHELKVDLDTVSGYALDFSKLYMIVNGVSTTDFTVNDSAKPTSPVAVVAGGTTYTLTATVNDKVCTATFKVIGTETTKESPSLVASNYEDAVLVGEAGGLTAKDTWHGAAPALQGIQIKYWSVAEKQYKTITLSDYTPTTAGQQSGTETTWTYTAPNNDFTLTLTGGQVHSSNNVNAMPVVVNSKLYFVAAGSSGLVNYGNSARTIPVSYSFKDNNGGTELNFSHTWSIECNDGDTAYDYSDFCDGKSTTTFTIKSSNGNGCVTGDTLVTLANGTQKRIDAVTTDDMLLAWNHFTGNYEAVPAAIIFNHGYDNNTVIKLNFSDGTQVKVINLHQFFDVDLNKYVSIDETTVADYVGHGFVKQCGDSYTTVALDSYEISQEYIEAYGIISALHYNILVEGMLSTDFMLEDYDLFNYFAFGEGVMFDAEMMQSDIEKYGLYTYEDFADYLTYEQFVAFNVQYFKIAVGKGNYTYEGILDLIDNYLNVYPSV